MMEPTDIIADPAATGTPTSTVLDDAMVLAKWVLIFFMARWLIKEVAPKAVRGAEEFARRVGGA